MMMTPCDVDYALQTLMSKIKERELESQRALNEQDVANRLLKLQLQELQNKLKEKDYQLADANETIRALRSVTQIITGLQDEIRALRTQLLASHAHKHRLVDTQMQDPEVLASPVRTQASDDMTHHTLDDMTHHTLFHPTEAGPMAPDYITQNSTQECTLLKLISDCGRTTDVAVPGVKQEEQEVLMDEGEGRGHEDRETEGQVPDESVKVENSEWDGGFEYSHAAHDSGELPDNDSSYAYSNHDMAAIEAATSSSSSHSSDSPAVQNATQTRKRQLVEAPLDSHSASVIVQTALRSKLGGDRIFQEYNKMKCLSDATRRKMVNILVADMMENHGPPPVNVRVSYALGIVTLFPLLKDLNSKNGYEHYYDHQSGSGYLAWRLKTVQRSSSSHIPRSFSTYQDGPRRLSTYQDVPRRLSTYQDVPRRPSTYQDGPRTRRPAHSAPPQISAEQCQEAVMLMRGSDDVALVRENMKATFERRQDVVHDPETTSAAAVLDLFPRFLDTPGLVNQDFTMLFGEEVSGRFLSRWQTFYKPRIIDDCKRLPHGTHMDSLLFLSSLSQPSEWSEDWDSDLATILLLLHLLPPTSKGKKHKKISAAEAGDHLVKFMKTGHSMENFLEEARAAPPFLLCVGERKSSIQNFFVVLEQKAIPCEVNTATAAFDELFKAHFVFGRSYDEPLYNFFTFLQTTVYGIDVGSAKESPRVREIRARLLNNSH
ncbi:uncharacterized protein LOC121718053 isoform X2 [Alosa sapidissima]|uniref:uncharacterized protein LOC121718053 isoform X2 n=1 Tax=Alosa sapidissima TaxID=34773 RepID=UPI001C0982AD|nr:uncharacterized protein LOC121718053 isoform X2 [Alosa sapidissima]